MVVTSIDLKGGKVVQLKQGREDVIERDDPIALAKEFDKYGEIAVIDLDAAMDQGNNLEIIKEILKVGECRVGGGVRTIEQAKNLFSFGANKVIVGSKIFEDDRINHDFLKDLTSNIDRRRIIVAVDAVKSEIVTEGWKHMTGLNLYEVLDEIEQYGTDFLFTCVEREGTLLGIDMAVVEELAKKIDYRITVAGGVNSIDELRNFQKFGVDVQLGMAIYTEKITLAQAFVESLNWENGLIPTITKDNAGQVLTLAFSNKESLNKTFETGRMWYFSRSRNKLWMKGETSGNIQAFLKIRADCDQDTLLATVVPKGVACHTGSYSCFGDRKFSLLELYDVIKDRLVSPTPGSYTAKLNDDLLNKKIMEEAQELIAAKNKDETIWEAADFIYFLTVLLAKRGVKVDDILFELQKRRRK